MADDDLNEQNRILRERVAQLERAVHSGTDPILRALIEHSDSFINVVTPEGRFLATGRPSEGFGSVVGRDIFDFIDADHVEPMRAVFRRVVETGRAEVYESTGYGEDGTPGHSYITRAVPLRDGDEVRSILLIPTDITERAKLERSLLEKENALRLAVDAARMGLWSWDVATNEIVWDQRMRDIWDVRETPTDYQTYLGLVHPDDRAGVEAVIQDAVATGVYRTMEHRLAPTADGNERWLLAAGTVIKDERGKPVRLMGGALDISERKHMAAQMQRAERVESIGQLTAGIAHNFNNLLAAIVPNIELALTEVTESQRKGLSSALDASLQARDLVRSLMALAGREPVKGAAHAAEVLRRVESMCQMTFPREITMRLSIAPEVGHVSMPVSDLEQVLLNLMLNARDALEASAGSRRDIDVIAELVSEGETRQVSMRVTDSGIGMSEAVRRRVFEPFFTTKPPHKGSGLGLANAAALVREAHGTIGCQSTPGLGTTFEIRLPTAPAPTSAGATPQPEAAPLGRETVLLVDDEPLVRTVMRRLLERDKYTVLEASSAAEARTLLDKGTHQIGLIILDQSMPKETGLEALPSLRARCKAPVVLFTGMAPQVPADIDALLEKPARPADLQRVLREVLPRKA